MIKELETEERSSGATITTVELTSPGVKTRIYGIDCSFCREANPDATYTNLAQLDNHDEAIEFADSHVHGPLS